MSTVLINGQTYHCDENKLLLQNVANPAEIRRFASTEDYHSYLYWLDRLQALVGHQVVAADMEYREGIAEPWFPVLRFVNGTSLTILSGDGDYKGGRFEVSVSYSRSTSLDQSNTNVFTKWADNRAVECAQCGQMATVPVTPQPGRPVYCRECYEARQG